jgi:hypothetical protein
MDSEGRLGRGLPSLVYKRDGRLVPFEADKISQSLYAATEELGQPSAFLARELTDGVLHFLCAEVEAEQPTTAQIAELVAKVVRELGQPALAQIYAEGQRRDHRDAPAALSRAKTSRSMGAFQFSTNDSPAAVVRQCLHAYSLQAVFARDLAAAHQEGLLSLRGLDDPEELARMVLEPSAGADWLDLLGTPARTIIFDSPEYALTEETAAPWLLGLTEFCAATGRTAVVNLHVTTPPAWADPGAHGPLFDSRLEPIHAAGSAAVEDLLLAQIQLGGTMHVRVDWHLSESDFAPQNLPRLETLAHRALEGSWLGFALDRPKHPVALAPGLDRRQAAVLLDVGLDLPRFLSMAGVDQDARLFLEKLPTLARMAVRAGVQKRNFLRSRAIERPDLARGFLLERARLVIVPLGLDRVVENLLGHGMAGSKLSLGLGRRIVEVLQHNLQRESLTANLEIAIDGPGGEFPGLAGPLDAKQLHTAGVLHGIAGFGTVLISEVTPQELVKLLSHAWKKTDVVRLARV